MDIKTHRLKVLTLLRSTSSAGAARPFVTDEIYKKRKHPYSAPLQYAVDGPLHQLMKRLVTRENIEELGFMDWTPSSNQSDSARSLGQLVDVAFIG